MSKLGIVGGMGPWAGVDLASKLLRQSLSDNDQNSIPFVLASVPSDTSGRSDYLTGKTNKSPAHGIVTVLKELENLQVVVAGIPCNTSHAPRIFNQVLKQVDKLGLKIKVLNMVELVAIHLRRFHGNQKNIGVLCTLGTQLSNVYPLALARQGFNTIQLNKTQALRLHDAIHETGFGLKSQSYPPTELACKIVKDCAADLIQQGAESIVLACTELPLALTEQSIANVKIVDSTVILARGMIESLQPDKLKPWPVQKQDNLTSKELEYCP